MAKTEYAKIYKDSIAVMKTFDNDKFTGFELTDIDLTNGKPKTLPIGKKASEKNIKIFMKFLKEYSNKYILFNTMRDFIVDTGLLDKFLLRAVSDCKKCNLNIELGIISFEFDKAHAKTLELHFDEKEKCKYVHIYLSNGIFKNQYACREIIINSEAYIYDNVFYYKDKYHNIPLPKKEANEKTLVVQETAAYKTYFSSKKNMGDIVKEALIAFTTGEPYSSDPKELIDDDSYEGLYFMNSNITEMSYIGTYKSRETPICNLYRTYKIYKNSDDKFNVEWSPQFDPYNIHYVLFRDMKALVRWNNIPMLRCLLDTESLEYTKEFIDKFSYLVKDLPGNKNFYYEDGFVLEVDCVKLGGEGKRLKITKNYYKLFCNQIWNEPWSMYAILPDEGLGTQYIYHKLGDNPEYEKIYENDLDKEEVLISKRNKIEAKIAKACQQVGVQYK